MSEDACLASIWNFGSLLARKALAKVYNWNRKCSASALLAQGKDKGSVEVIAASIIS
jgi:hypothetical protein